MWISILSQISQLEQDIADLNDLHTNKDRQPEDTLAPGVTLDGWWTTSQTRRIVRMIMAKQEQVRLLKKELAEYEAPACPVEGTCTEPEAFEPAEDRSWWLVTELAPPASFHHTTDAHGVTTFRHGASVGIW